METGHVHVLMKFDPTKERRPDGPIPTPSDLAESIKRAGIEHFPEHLYDLHITPVGKTDKDHKTLTGYNAKPEGRFWKSFFYVGWLDASRGGGKRSALLSRYQTEAASLN